MQILKAAPGGITGHFGDTGVPGAHVAAHQGMDVGHGDSTPADLAVIAPAAGTIVAAGSSGTYGNRIIIDHGGGWSTLLAHLAAILVTVGSQVTLAQLVATMGDTGGDWPVHLHQELRLDGVPVDPEQHLASLASLTTSPIRKIRKMDVLFARGHLSTATYRIDLLAMTRSYVKPENGGILTVYQANGGVVATIPQAALDAIAKEAGSR